MRVHRFYVGERWERSVQHFGQERCWVQDKELTHQWHKVLRLRAGDELSLFDGSAEFLYKIVQIKTDETALQKVTELQSKKPPKHVLLAWSLLKKDNNDWVLQKATEVGVTHLVPMITERSEKTGFNHMRANKIVIEAAEQCGRINIPMVDEVRTLNEVINTYKDPFSLFMADEKGIESNIGFKDNTGMLIGPEGGWSEKELVFMKNEGIETINLGNMTLRAETAAVVAATKILGISP